MTFAEPLLLWFLALPVAWLAYELWPRNAKASARWPRIARRWAGPRGVAEATRGSLAAPRWRLALGLGLAVVALARPQAGYIEEKTYDPSREVLLALDLSRSMLAEDVKPNRLQRARLLIETLLDKLKGERVGLLLFSGTAFLQSPLSSDYEVLREFLPNLDPDYLPEGGTDYDQLLKAALESYSNEAGADRYLIVLSDGESQTDAWRQRLTALKDRRVRAIALGIGTAAGSVMPLKEGGFVKDERGAVVMSRLEPATLQQLASATGGAYVDASEWIDLPAILAQTVERGKVTSSATRTTRRLREQFQWFLGSALLLLAWSYWIEFPVRPRAREVVRRGANPANTAARPHPAATTSVGLLALAGTLVAFTPPSSALAASVVPLRPTTPAPSVAPPALTVPASPATTFTPPPENSVLPKIVERLAAKPDLEASDWAHLARETISFGESELAAQRRPKPGIVHDALTAVDLGEQLNPKAADWADLRGKLRKLLEPPPQQQEQQQKQDKDQQNKQDQKQQQDQPQKNEDQSSDSQEKSEPKSPEKSDPAKEPQSDQQPQSDKSQSDDKSPPKSPPKSDQPSGDPASNDAKPSEPQTPRQKAFDTPSEPSAPAPAEPATPPPATDQPTQVIGGEKPASDELEKNPHLAVPLQKLEEARANDSPGRLFKLLQRDTQPPQKPKKDW